MTTNFFSKSYSHRSIFFCGKYVNHVTQYSCFCFGVLPDMRTAKMSKHRTVGRPVTPPAFRPRWSSCCARPSCWYYALNTQPRRSNLKCHDCKKCPRGKVILYSQHIISTHKKSNFGLLKIYHRATADVIWQFVAWTIWQPCIHKSARMANCGVKAASLRCFFHKF